MHPWPPQVEIGSTKGKVLTNSVRQIYADFLGALASFQALDYDILDVEEKAFDEDFYKFRCTIKELERRLGAVQTLRVDCCVV
jgi:dynein heavy chain